MQDNADHPKPRRLTSRAKTRERIPRSDITYWRWEKKGILTPIRINGRVFYHDDQIDALIEHGAG